MWAHSGNATGQRQPLVAHLRNVAKLAGGFGEAFGARDLAYYAGLWHDLGKADPAWQEYLLGNEAGTRRRGTGPDHKGAGAILALRAGRPDIAMLIHAHHGGLQDPETFRAWLEEKSRVSVLAEILADVASWLPEAKPEILQSPTWDANLSRTGAEQFLRLAYSALVDADSLDTEHHHADAAPVVRGTTVTIEDLWHRFEAHPFAHDSTDPTPVNDVRREVYAACLAAADLQPGLFRLTVPTGGGKTRSAMAFALKHALLHGLRRVIVAVPFTTITEQTAGVYREIFEPAGEAEPIVLEHHSGAVEETLDEGQSYARRKLWLRLAAENWDAPVVVTTTVQLLESLFSNKRGRTRKLHNLARSVIVLDEAQALPAPLLTPILDALKDLCASAGASVVFSTATQPAFEMMSVFADVDARDIVPDNARHFDLLRRVEYEWRVDSRTGWSELAGELQQERKALVIVNVKRHAMELLDAMGSAGDVFHLSTLMCGAHRRAVLAEIRQRLKKAEPCRVVSTQVVEAGVDLDFPVVFRALAPLDSIIQAAGRCNREGRLKMPGRVVIFEPHDATIPAGYGPGIGATRSILAGREVDGGDLAADGLAVTRAYFANLYQLIGDRGLDHHGIQELRNSMDYPSVGDRFRMIADDTFDVIVPYPENRFAPDVEKAIDSLRREFAQARLILRQLQPFLIGVRRRDAQRFAAQGLIEELVIGRVGVWLGGYDDLRGIVTDSPEYIV